LYKGIEREGVSIEHVGSTAVPGLGGKNILDVAVGIRAGTLNEFKKPIENLGYDFVETSGTKRRLFFVRDVSYKGKDIRMHLHLARLNGPDWIQHVAFRDYLVKHKDAVLEYARVKKRAVKAAKGKKKIYMKEKADFIREITKRALESEAESNIRKEKRRGSRLIGANVESA
jgi:GrpB-like predicted nucleotidyltransferase (UPF0157 family)